jgi:hypothetical protein
MPPRTKKKSQGETEHVTANQQMETYILLSEDTGSAERPLSATDGLLRSGFEVPLTQLLHLAAHSSRTIVWAHVQELAAMLIRTGTWHRSHLVIARELTPDELEHERHTAQIMQSFPPANQEEEIGTSSEFTLALYGYLLNACGITVREVQKVCVCLSDCV